MQMEDKDCFGADRINIDAAETKKGGLPGFERLSDEDQMKELRKMFREVFGTPHGRIVLGSILEDLYCFRTCTNDESRTLNNYGKFLIHERLGLNDNKKLLDSLLDC